MCAILIIVLHSILDFEMSYYLIMLVTYSLIAILVSKTNENSKIKINKKIAIALAIIIIIPNIIVNTKALYSRAYCEPQMLKSTTLQAQKLNMQKTNVELNPYNLKYLKTYIKSWQIYRISIKEIKPEESKAFIIKTNNLIEKLYQNEPYYLNPEILDILQVNTIQLLKYGEEEKAQEYLELLLKIYNNNGIINQYRVESMLECQESMQTLKKQLDELKQNEWASKVQELINEKTEIIGNQIKNYEKCEITEERSQRYLQSLKKY